MQLACHSCGHENELHGPLGRRDVCVSCDAELRCCMQCKLYEESSATHCREPNAEVQRDKDRANFCDFFVPFSGKRAGESEADKAKAAFDALFKK